LWDGASFIGSLMVGCFRKAGEQPTIEIVAPGSAPRSNSPGGRGRQDQAVFSAGVQLRQRHRLLRDLESDLENRLPALVENFAQGLVRTVLQLRRSDATAGAEETGAGAGGVSSRQERIRAAELFFRTHLAQGVKIGDLARYLHLSVARTSQILRRDMKSTFPAQLRRVRLDEARRLLAVSVLPVGRIAELVGFTDRNYFCRVFTQDAGLTPSAYRKQNARPLRV
jgi:AraC-like DNA-binding protein